MKLKDAPWKKSCDKPRQCIKKQGYHFADKGPNSQSCGFSRSHVQMWEFDHNEGWVPRSWCFKLWCYIRLLRVLWTARRSNQSILKLINPEYSLEGLMVKLKLQYFGHLIWRANSLKAGGEGDDGGWDSRMASPTQWTWVWASSRRWWRTGKLGMLQSMGSQRVRHNWVTEQQ